MLPDCRTWNDYYNRKFEYDFDHQFAGLYVTPYSVNIPT